MAEITVKVGSVTNAQKARKALIRNGFRASITRAVQLNKGDGCGYSVTFYGDRDEGLRILKHAGVKIISVKANGLSR